MTTKFEVPVLDQLEWVNTEVSYVGSGVPSTEPEKPSEKGDWLITTGWANHNSGHHSELKIRGVHSGVHTGNSITMHFHVEGFKLATIQDSNGYAFANVSETGFSITRTGFYNGSDNFEFNIQITASDSPYQGSVGVTGQPCAALVICDSYEEA